MKLDNNSYKKVVENLYDGLYIVDKDRVITYWNKAAERISGYSSEEVLGKSCADNILTHIDCGGNCLCTRRCPLAATMADEIPREAEVYLHHKDGQRVPVSVRVNPLEDENGKVIGGIELFTDLSNKEANELRVKELEALALLDSLTQLANRTYINQEICQRLDELKRSDGSCGILFMDIDHFKKINDTHGHPTGDRVLKYLAETFISNARPFDLYGRWGGEEFSGIIRNITPKGLELLGDRLRMLIEESYIIHEEQKLHVTISIGATLAQKNDSIESLIKRADTLLYKSKNSGRNRLTIDAPNTGEKVQQEPISKRVIIL